MQRTRLLSTATIDQMPLNDNGNDLIDLCKATGPLILNGHVGIDEGIGRHTRVDENDSGVVDFVQGAPSIFMMVDSFKIRDKFPESDHLPLVFSLQLGTCRVDRIEVDRGQWSIRGNIFGLLVVCRK